MNKIIYTKNIKNKKTCSLFFFSIKTCIRRAKHMCCTQYNICATYNGIALADWTNGDGSNMGSGGVYNEGWSFDINTASFIIDATQSNVGLVDSQCTGDYVEIPCEWYIR